MEALQALVLTSTQLRDMLTEAASRGPCSPSKKLRADLHQTPTQRALRRLDEIGAHIEKDSPDAAACVVARIVSAAEHLAEQPAMGRIGRIKTTRELVLRDCRNPDCHARRPTVAAGPVKSLHRPACGLTKATPPASKRPVVTGGAF
ncbi:type II toxin-antitoxin system RelE/ParE family toxin [Mesorhizobium caraganae]|uniref:type II toxin-antitoxin system RelE/ParE family toxin n=1 Tax=Mesorhizobium caraganae TaxID=483206 RepID=UPI0035E40C18